MKKEMLKPWQVVLFAFIFLNVMTFVHELGHYFTLKMFGCPAHPPAVWFVFGATGFECSQQDLQPWQWWIIAYAGSLFAFVASTLLWNYFGKDSYWRLAALIGYMYGVIPNLIWHVPGTDAYFAVSAGFPPTWATLIFVGAISYVSWILYKEIAEIG